MELADIVTIEQAKVKPAPEESAKAPYVFEIRLQTSSYFVGEDPTFGGRDGNIVVSSESGIGLEQARYWEHAIRQALMPVTPTSSVAGGISSQRCKLYILFSSLHISLMFTINVDILYPNCPVLKTN